MDAASAFIRSTNAGSVPASHRARLEAPSLADWVRRASSISCSVRTSPTTIGTLDSSLWSSLSYSATSALVTVIEGPAAPAGSGWSRSTTRAVVILLSEATGTDGSGPDLVAYPSDGTATAACPTAGQGREGTPPG